MMTNENPQNDAAAPEADAPAETQSAEPAVAETTAESPAADQAETTGDADPDAETQNAQDQAGTDTSQAGGTDLQSEDPPPPPPPSPRFRVGYPVVYFGEGGCETAATVTKLNDDGTANLVTFPDCNPQHPVRGAKYSTGGSPGTFRNLG